MHGYDELRRGRDGSRLQPGGRPNAGLPPGTPFRAPASGVPQELLCSIGAIIAGGGVAGEIWQYIQQLREISIESGRFAASQVQ